MADLTTTNLELQDLVAGYGGQPLLEPLSLTVEAGTATALVGRSGLGKSTLLRSVAALIDPVSGSVTLGGQTPQAIGWASFRRRVIYVAQQPVMLEGSVLENLHRPWRYRCCCGDGSRWDRQQAASRLAAVGIDNSWLDRPATEMSVGQQHRVALVRALLLRPAALLLDEPTSALDEASRDMTLAALQTAMADWGLMILMATHQPQWAKTWCRATAPLLPARAD